MSFRHLTFFAALILVVESCATWQPAVVNSPLGRYNHNLAAGWSNHTEIDEFGNEIIIQVEPGNARYIDLFLYKRKFEMIFYQEGYDSIVEFVQPGRWYMEMSNDSLFVILNYQGKKVRDRFFFGENANAGIYDQLKTIPAGEVYQKTDKVFN